MSAIGIDIGTSTTKIIEVKNGEIISKAIIRGRFSKEIYEEFLKNNEIENIEKVVFTGIGADKIIKEDYGENTFIIDEFTSIAKGALALTDKEEALIVSVGTGTAFIDSNKNECKHLGGTGLGAGTLFNFSKAFLKITNFDEMLELIENGDVEKVDLRIKDITTQEIETLPLDLTLANFGKLNQESRPEDIAAGLINMVFEIIGMMAVFIVDKKENKDVVLIGNITGLPGVRTVLDRIEKVKNINFFVPEDSEFSVAYGAIVAAN